MKDQHLYSKPIVIYDGECVLCSSAIRRILRYEKSSSLTFATLKSSNIAQLQIVNDEEDSILFYVDGKVSSRSTAAFEIARYLKAPWSWLRFFSVLPTVVTDFGYQLIAKYRYRWFGKVDDVCVLTDELGDRYVG